MRNRKRKLPCWDLDDLIDALEAGKEVEMKIILMTFAYEIHHLQVEMDNVWNWVTDYNP